MQLTGSHAAALAAGLALGTAASLLARRLFRYTPPRVWQFNAPSGGAFASINRPTAGARQAKKLPVGKHPIQLYSEGTPNGVKVTIALEEICDKVPDFDYDAWRQGIGGAQFDSGFVEINPNSKIPAMVDHSTDPPTRVFESGAILLYLAEKFPEAGLLPKSGPVRQEAINWVFWQMGSGPYIGGGFGHFFSYAPEKMEYPINRFTMETKRQLDVLEKQLATHEYIAGDVFTIADIAIWPWYGALALDRLYPGSTEFLDVEKSYPSLVRWAKMLDETRPAVRRGRMVNRSNPEPSNKLYASLPALKERHARSDWSN
mmetsp:Transcript_5750/g.12559  ORF Transcript_5750/g.12559 Transcript_5750/m.12559 type:complete len:316 (+) Transcript_5750:143-1090(+)